VPGAPPPRRIAGCGGGWRAALLASRRPRNARGTRCAGARSAVVPLPAEGARSLPLPAPPSRPFRPRGRRAFPRPPGGLGSTSPCCSCGDGPSAKACRGHLGRRWRSAPCSCPAGWPGPSPAWCGRCLMGGRRLAGALKAVAAAGPPGCVAAERAGDAAPGASRTACWMGFQLSVAATAGLILTAFRPGAGPCQRWLPAGRSWAWNWCWPGGAGGASLWTLGHLQLLQLRCCPLYAVPANPGGGTPAADPAHARRWRWALCA